MSSSNRAAQLPSRATAPWLICCANPTGRGLRKLGATVYIVTPSMRCFTACCTQFAHARRPRRRSPRGAVASGPQFTRPDRPCRRPRQGAAASCRHCAALGVWLCSVVRAVRSPAYTVPSHAAGLAFLGCMGERFGSASARALSSFALPLGWHYIRLSRSWSWTASCDERGAERVCSKLESRGYCMLSVSLRGALLMARGGAWRDGDVSVVSERDVAAVLCEYARDV